MRIRTLLTALQYLPKRTSALVAMIAAAVIVPTVIFAWGPDRPTYTIERPADHVTFNSITNNPNIGDERNFVGIREQGTTGVWSDNMAVQPGKSYVVRMYVHNNAADNLNLVAKDVTAKFNLPTNTAKSLQVNGFLSASNATPKEVYDHATFTGSENFNLNYQEGTLKYYNNHFGSAGAAIGENVFTSAGAKLGYDKLDGNIPGCFKYAGYLTFVVKPQFATTKTDFEVKKDVRKDSGKTFAQSVDAKAGDKLNYRVTYSNTGSSTQKNVMLKDTLPAGVSHVPGSVKIMNANNPNGAVLQDGDKLFTASGVNIGHYTAGSNAVVVFDAKVAANGTLPKCGPNVLKNVVSAQPEGQNPKEDDADVTVPKECQPPTPTPEYACTSLTATKISRAEYSFTGSATATNGATIVSYTFDFGDGNTKTVTNPKDVPHTYTAAKSYTVKMSVTVKVNSSNKTVTSDACKVQTTVTPQTPEECKPGIPVGDERCEEKPPVEECKPGIPVGDERCEEKPPVDECKPGIPTGDERCEEKCDVPGKEHLPKDSPDCEETPVAPTPETPTTPETPAELPKTGISDALTALLGAGSLIAAISYYVASRRSLIN